MNDRIPGTTWDNPVWYGKWRIYIGDPESGYAYQFTHDDYDGAPDAHDNRHGHAVSVAAAKEEIDELDRDIKAMDGCKAPPGVCKSKELGCIPGERDPSHDHCKYDLHMDTDTTGDLPDSVDFGAPRVRFKWATPEGDTMIAHMARVSNSKAKPDDPAERLIGYLLRNHHWSPFEMANLCVEIHTERDISAQILRHSKEFRFQEFSTRYAEVEDLRWSTECRFQHPTNRQASSTVEDILEKARADVERDPALAGADLSATTAQLNGYDVDATVSYFDAVVNETRVRSLEAYRELLERGVAKECARRVLPIGLMPTVMYINSNVRGWIHYLAERTKPGVQKEHREIALAVEPLFAAHYPLVWEAVVAMRVEQSADAERVVQMKKIEELMRRYDTVLIGPLGGAVGWALNNNKYEWKEL